MAEGERSYGRGSGPTGGTDALRDSFIEPQTSLSEGIIEAPRPRTVRHIRLNTGFTQEDLRLLGDGDVTRGTVRYLEEFVRLGLEGKVTPDTRPLGEELDLLKQNLIQPPKDPRIN